MDLKTTWKCRNGIVEYLEANPNSPQKEVLMEALKHLISELKNDIQDTKQLERNTDEIKQALTAVGDDNEKKIEHMNYLWDLMMFATPDVYPVVSNKDFPDKAIKVYEVLNNPILRRKAGSTEAIEAFSKQAKDIDSTAITDVEREAVLDSIGKKAKILSYDDYIDYVIYNQEKELNTVI